jgi:NitT/TauT family transport system substrate-binding protein
MLASNYEIWFHFVTQEQTGEALLKRSHLLSRFAAAVVLAGATALAEIAAAQAMDRLVVRVGIASAISDVAIFIADRKGYFREEGLVVTTTNFTSAANMVAPLGAGQLDVGGGSPSAGFYNAVARGFKLRIVADKASSQPGYAVNRLLVLKSHAVSGRFKTLADLKGMKIAMNGPGVSNRVTLDTALKRGGLKISDVETVDLPFPEHVTALQNKAVDASVTTEPQGTVAIKNGSAVPVVGDDELVPGHQIATVLYSEDFATKNPDAARRFMKAYLRGVRFYNDALQDGRMAGPNADEVIGILTQSTLIKDSAIFRAITPSGCDPDGRINVASLKFDFEFYRRNDLIKGDVTVDQVVDYSSVDAAVRELGPYRKAVTK